MGTWGKWIFSSAIFFILPAVAVPGQALDSTTLRLDWVLNGKHAPFFLGVEKGFYREAGIDLKVLEGKGSGTTIQLIGSGDGAFGLASLASLAEAVGKGIPAVSVYVFIHDSAYSVLSLKETGIKTPKDLIGRTIGVSPGGTSRAVLPAFLLVNAIDPKQVKEVAFEGMGRINALLMKKVDSAVGPYPEYVPIMESKGAQVSTMKLNDWGLSLLGFGIVVHPRMITENPGLIRRFLQASTRSITYAMANPEEGVNAMAKGYIKAEPKIWVYDWKLMMEAMGSKYTKGKPMGWQPKEEWEQTRDFLGRYVNKAIGEIPLTKFYTNDFINP